MGGDHQLLFHAHFFDPLAEHARKFDATPDDAVALAGVKADRTAIFGMGFEHAHVMAGPEDVLLDSVEQRAPYALSLIPRRNPEVRDVVAHRLAGAPAHDRPVLFG